MVATPTGVIDDPMVVGAAAVEGTLPRRTTGL
jgi:hypothetical protein